MNESCLADRTTCSNELNLDNQIKENTIGIIGLGRICEALLSKLAEPTNGNGTKINGIKLYYRDKDERRVNGLIQQVDPIIGKRFPIEATSRLCELGTSDIIIVTIGRELIELQKNRVDLTGEYFKDIKEIMGDLGLEYRSKILMATNPVTPNCFVADHYSLKDNPIIIGFTRLDYIRAIYILRNWLEQEKIDIKDLPINLNVIGPHGYDMIITNIRVGDRRPIYTNEDLFRELNFRDRQKTLENLSLEVSRYGKRTFRDVGILGTPSLFASQLVSTMYLILGGGEDTAAIYVNLNDLCSSNLDFPEKTYIGLPVIYKNGIPSLSQNLDINKIPIDYKKQLVKTLKIERGRIFKYLN